MSRELELLANQNRPAGKNEATPVAIADTETQATVMIDRAGISANVNVSISLEISIDGGPFTFWAGCETVGGDHVLRSGLVSPTTEITRDLPPGINRQLRGSYQTDKPARTRLRCGLRTDADLSR